MEPLERLAMNTWFGRAALIFIFALAGCGGGGGGEMDTFHAVSATADAGGAVSPTSREVKEGNTATFEVSVDTGYTIASVSGCDGTLDGGIYTTGTVMGPCTVTASFAPAEFVLSYTAGPNGSLVGAASQTVTYGASGASVTAVPDQGYSFSQWSDSSTANPRTDNNVDSDLSVRAAFARNSYRVLSVAGRGGSITPESDIVLYGDTAAFTVTAENGYRIEQVTGCDGTLDDSMYTTSPVVDACTVEARFARHVTAVGSCSTTPQDTEYASTLQAEYTEPSSFISFTLDDGSLGPLKTANGGEVIITDTTTGDFIYTPGIARGRDTFRFSVADTEGNSSSATETLVVHQAIMPLGDSITSGYINETETPPNSLRVGYREELQDLLKASGIPFDFVGTVSHGWDVPDFDFNHEGHDGFAAASIAWGPTGYPQDGVRAWLDRNPADFILLHIGTNDPDPSNYIDVAAILDEIELWESSASSNEVHVIVALIIDRSPNDWRVTLFNENVETMVEERIESGAKISMVDHQGALIYSEDMADLLHPNLTGYRKMAAVWFKNLAPLMDRCP